MENVTLAESYLKKAAARLIILPLLASRGDFSDVIREAQEAVELAQKAMLRAIGVEPPKLHDVGHLLLEYRDAFPAGVAAQVDELARISKWLRKEREFSFYGDVDFIPTLEYSEADAKRAMDDAKTVLAAAEEVVSRRESGE